jgi:hypothetical protein
MLSLRSTSIGAPLLALVIALATLTPAHAQQSRPPLRQLGRAVSTSEALGAVSAVRQLPNGMLLVNDPSKRQLLLMDSSLKTIAVVADTTSATKHAYGARGGGLLAFRGDSTLFVDPASLSMLVIDPAGKIVRVMAAPRASDIQFLVGGPLGNPGFDAKGRLVYRLMSFPGMRGGPAQLMAPPSFPDTNPIVRFDLATRKLDTAAFLQVAAPRMNVVRTENNVSVTPIINPLTEVDDWAVLSDGTIAIVRKDYHVDYIDADGKKTSAPKVPFEWQRLSDSAKSAIVDSAKAQMERLRAMGPGAGGMNVVINGGPGGGPPGGGPPPGGGGGTPIIVMRDIGGAAPPQRGGAPNAAPGGSSTAVNIPQISFVQPSELPDYRPAFTNGSVRADAAGKLWVRVMPTKPLAGGPEYDVIDRNGTLVDRVALPVGTTIAGFGQGGVVYLGVRDSAGTHVVRARER